MNRFLLLFSILFIPVLAQAQESIPKDALVAHYSFDGHAFDVSGHGNHGEAFGPTPTEDRFGNFGSAYFFDGSDYIDTYFSFDSDPRSISVWVKASFMNYQEEGYDTQTIIMQDSDELENGAFGLTFNDGMFRFREGYTEGFWEHSVELKTWHHLILVKDGDVIKGYLNGILLGEGIAEDRASSSNPYKNMLIGTTRLKDRYFIGSIDDIQIFKYALTESMVQDLYSQAGWPLTENSTSNSEDSTRTLLPRFITPPPPIFK